jgi:acid phosphatase
MIATASPLRQAPLALLAGLLLLPAVPVPAQSAGTSPVAPPAPSPSPAPPEARQALAVKYVRDSAEYVALCRMVYGFATRALAEAPAASAGKLDAVVLDIDETVLDNSVAQLELEAYGLAFGPEAWSAWVRRGQAAAVPGAVDFVRAARGRGLRVAYISDRDTSLLEATRENLRAQGLWDDGDRLCLRTSRERTKRVRRGELRDGQCECAFAQPARVLAYLGDQYGDFPEDGEQGAESRRADGFGRTQFVLPNPMYGAWASRVTRPLP